MRQRRAIRAVAGATFVVLLAASLPGWAQESVAVRAMMTKGPIPLDDPNAAAWSSAPQSQFPLSPQVHWQNRIQEVTVKDIKVRSLNDGQRLTESGRKPDREGSSGHPSCLEICTAVRRSTSA